MRKFIGRIIWWFLKDYRNQALYLIEKHIKETVALSAPVAKPKLRKQVLHAKR